MHIAPTLIQAVRKHQLEQNYVFQDASQPNAVASPHTVQCVCLWNIFYINQPELENPTMTATTGEVPSGDGNCECGDGKYTLKIKPLKVRYDSMPRRQIKVYIKYTATIECGGEVTKTSDAITITTNGNDHSFPANTEILDFGESCWKEVKVQVFQQKGDEPDERLSGANVTSDIKRCV